MSPSERREMIRKGQHKLSLTRQCKLLKISRSSIYYTPVGVNAETLKLMHEIDRVFTKYPFFGSRQIAAYLPQSGFSAGRHRVRRLMKHHGVAGHLQGPKYQQEAPTASIYPYSIEKAGNHAAQSGLVQRHYLHSRQERLPVLWWRSWTGRPAKCCPGGCQIRSIPASVLEALDDAIAKYGKPEIMNTDRGGPAF